MARLALLVSVILGVLTVGITIECIGNAKLCCRRNNITCEFAGGCHNEHQYKIEGKDIIIKYSQDMLTVQCWGLSVLDSPALPSADPLDQERVGHIVFNNCTLPTNRSLAGVLEALDITLVSRPEDGTGGILQLDQLSTYPPLSEEHLTGLEHLLELHISAPKEKHVQSKTGFLRPLTILRKLIVEEVTLPSGELDKPLPHLRTLILKNTGVERLTTQLLLSSTLRSLTIESKHSLDSMTVPPKLKKLNLKSPAINLTLDTVADMPNLTLKNWLEVMPRPLSSCDNLNRLELNSPVLKKLPAFWLSKCTRLETLVLIHAKNLSTLPPNLLENVTTLTHLAITNSALTTLPQGLLNTTPNIQRLDLTGNRKLRTLPSNLFSVARGVRDIYLYRTDLDNDAVAALASLPELQTLSLKGNKRIQNICSSTGKSPMHESRKLANLNLEETSVSQICSDWREDMPMLKILNLRNTNVSELSFQHLQFKSEPLVLLENTVITAIRMNRTQYTESIQMSERHTRLQLGTQSMTCDCHMYWTQRAFTENYLKHVSAFNISCMEGKDLKNMLAEEMLCLENGTSGIRECDTGKCKCRSRPDMDRDDAERDVTLVRVECENRDLDQVPVPPLRNLTYYELLLAHNHIAVLPADILLRSDIKKLDLRNNSFKTMDRETAKKLHSFKGMLLLANNKVDCSCHGAPLVRAFFDRALNRTDLENIQCTDGRALIEASSEDCMPLTSWLACVLTVLFVLGIVAVVFLSSRKRRFFLKAVLHRWGCLYFPAEPREDRNRLYDAFVTFSHKDESVVMELMTRLEPTYRLCMHQRDWIPGRSINEQITESVANSKRTIAIVSRHYQKSEWALAEFRQAYTAAMREARQRLIVVLLEDPSVLELDKQLGRYLETNTYVRWGDSWFWDKLAAALPRPRPNNTNETTPLVVEVSSAAAATTANCRGIASHDVSAPHLDPVPTIATTKLAQCKPTTVAAVA